MNSLFSKLKELSRVVPHINPVRIIAEALNYTPREVYNLRTLTEEQIVLIKRAVNGIEAGVPLARIFGRKCFYDSVFTLSSYAFEPRPETEALVEYVQQNLKPKRVLDVCTGSGAILLSILKLFPRAKGIGTDISKHCILNAIENAQNMQMDQRANFVQTNFTEGIEGEFDLVISNPPYVIKEVDQATQFDPPLALYENNAYEYIIANNKLASGGHLILEIPIQKDVDQALDRAKLNLVIKQKIGSELIMLIAKKLT